MDAMPGAIEVCDMAVRLAERSDSATHNVQVKADLLLTDRQVAVRRRKAERPEMTFGDIPQAVLTLGIRRVTDPGNIAKLRWQQMPPQNALGPAVVAGID